MKSKFISLVVLVALGVFAWWMLTARGVTVIAGNVTLDGDLDIAAGKRMLVKNGATVRVKGKLSINGELICAGNNGPLLLQAGSVTVNGTINCSSTDGESTGGISLIAGTVRFGDQARVLANGHVQLVSQAAYLATSETEIQELFEDAARDTGTGPRIGPFVEKAGLRAEAPDAGGRPYRVRVAQAQAPRDDQDSAAAQNSIGGTWYIGDGGTPPKDIDVPAPPSFVKKIIVNFNFGPNGSVAFKNFYLAGPNGRDGDSDLNSNCAAQGKRGGDAFRMRVVAADILADDFTLLLGSGGDGGDAVTIKNCNPGRASGGDGGEAGNFKMNASGGITINSFSILPGRGGRGGQATAQGKDGANGCPGERGGDAFATGGRGGANKRELRTAGGVSSLAKVTVDAVTGGVGGTASAQPGTGGAGSGCGCNGGKGGNGTATGGRGGDASVKVVGTESSARGGNGGDADSKGGTGGAGGMCGPEGSGGHGGMGGAAAANEGQGGNGTSGNGAAGRTLAETGGAGGDGGNGCGEGSAGAGGQGRPDGAPGTPGKRMCTGPLPEDPRTTGEHERSDGTRDTI